MTTLAQDAEALLALTSEIELDGDLLAATRQLRDVAAEYDEVSGRFDEVAQTVGQLLAERVS